MSFLKSKTLFGLVGLAALVALVVMFNLPQTAAQTASNEAPTLQKGTLTLEAATERTLAQMEAMDRTMGPRAVAPIGVPFQPTMDPQQYQAAKAAFLRAPTENKAPLAPATPPVLKTINFSGDQNTGWYPPDTDGAVGLNQYVQVVNSDISVYKKANPGTSTNLLKRVTLNSFFGYATQSIFDPQVVYDDIWRRWIVCSPAFPEGPGLPMYFFVAISKTTDATGSWWIYAFNTRSFFNGDFFDYPKVGMDQDSIIFTANNFVNNGGYIDSRFFSLAKARVYNGLFVTFTYFYGYTSGTIIPPVVLDNNGHTYLMNAPSYASPGGATINKFDLTNSSHSNPAVAVSGIPVTLYSVPPQAAQPGTTFTLDTLDARFVSRSTQVGNSLFNVHTVGLGTSPFPFPSWYEFDVAANTVLQHGYFFASGSSHDWNASLAANIYKDVFVCWTSTDPGFGINAQVRFAGRRNFADPGTMGISPTILKGSNTFYSSFRWGDYSAVNIDPSRSTRLWAYVTNEWINTNTATGWGSQISRIGY